MSISRVLWLGALVCVLLELATWRALSRYEVPQAPPSALVLVAVPADSQILLKLGHQDVMQAEGSLVVDPPPTHPELHVSHPGYYPLHLSAGQVQALNRQPIYLQPLWWRALLNHAGALAALVFAVAAWVRRSRQA